MKRSSPTCAVVLLCLSILLLPGSSGAPRVVDLSLLVASALPCTAPSATVGRRTIGVLSVEASEGEDRSYAPTL
jgi:hypothetical protein